MSKVKNTVEVHCNLRHADKMEELGHVMIRLKCPR